MSVQLSDSNRPIQLQSKIWLLLKSKKANIKTQLEWYEQDGVHRPDDQNILYYFEHENDFGYEYPEGYKQRLEEANHLSDKDWSVEGINEDEREIIIKMNRDMDSIRRELLEITRKNLPTKEDDDEFLEKLWKLWAPYKMYELGEFNSEDPESEHFKFFERMCKIDMILNITCEKHNTYWEGFGDQKITSGILSLQAAQRLLAEYESSFELSESRNYRLTEKNIEIRV